MSWFLLVVLGLVLFIFAMKFRDFADYKKAVGNLQADTRVAEVLVTESRLDEKANRFITTIKFMEYGVDQIPREPKYFTFSGNQIQFQSLVVRFDDASVKAGDPFKGKSIYLFWKAFVLNGSSTEEFIITPINEIPAGYDVPGISDRLQKKIWKRFWEYALQPEARKGIGIKNAQLEAPGSVFVPGSLYTLRIEHDGGLRIDSKPIPAILRGETIR